MVIRSWVKIPSLTGDRERRAFVYLPVGYDEADETRYPVLYMFDGHNLFSDDEATFGKCWGMEKFLDENEVPLIVAAVECNHEGNCRLSEYSPVNFDFHGEKIVGRGRKYMNWLTGVFKPFIDGNYKTLPDRANTAVAGSSMGGLMTLYALAVYGKYFSRGAALSPSLWVQNGEVPDFLTAASFRRDTLLFCDYGEKEFKNHEPQRALFGETFKILCDKGVSVTARIVPGGTHSEASWEREIPYFLKTLGLI
ncbi:MAG: alpha/beta hydrolase-fold protein [Roseburia sp.]|nr:alpha/beta hydrolase-fold protein [Roseburia sp.]